MNEFLRRLTQDRALPLVSPSDVDDGVRGVDRARAAGLGLVEVALRTDVAMTALAAAVAAADGVSVGAGTVRLPDQVDEVVAAGAAFVVTPGFSVPVVQRCLDLGVPVLPGIATAGEAMGALQLGLTVAKLFPAAVLGGPAFVRALAGPFPDLQLVPSGGVRADDADDYLSLPTVLAVSGSWMLDGSR